MTPSSTIDVSATQSASQTAAVLLRASDPAPVETCHAQSSAPVFLLCEHAGQAVPKSLNGLGLTDGVIDQHIGWDIGAEALARAISDRLQCPLILQRYSRLVMDCNRPPGAEGSVPEVSDGVPVPGNAGLSADDFSMRREAIFDPLNDAITAAFDASPRQAVFAIHSFTRQFQGQDRPWDAGFLTRRDTRSAEMLMASLAAAEPTLNLALNEPYQIDDASDWFIPRHAEARGMRHTLVEVRNDHLTKPAGVERWAELLSFGIQKVLEDTP